MPKIWRSPCGNAELYEGDYRQVLPPAVRGAIIFDPPYSGTTHSGHNAAASQVRSATGQPTFQAIGYEAWEPGHVTAFFDWASDFDGWIFGMTDDVLAPAWRAEAKAHGRYDFAPVSIIQKRPRLLGDGPASWTVYGMSSRPRTTRFSRWGCLPGSYSAPTASVDGISGAKPIGLMKALIEHYSRPGDLIIDPTMGSGTTIAAALACGRRAIGAEIHPDRFRLAINRIGWGTTMPSDPQEALFDQ